jgi:hypothetical protein
VVWLIPTILIACIATFWLGYHFRDLTKKVEHLEEVIQTKVSKKIEPEEPKSTIIDPGDEVSEAIYAHEVMMQKMNPHE